MNIYKLYDPRQPETVFYIGQTSKPLDRCLQFLLCKARRAVLKPGARHTPVVRWASELITVNVVPQIELLETISQPPPPPLERWMDLLKPRFSEHTSLTQGVVGGKISAHTRWHVKRGVTSSECRFCQEAQ